MRIVSPAAAAGLAAPGDAIYIAGCTAEPSIILDAVESDPELWRGIHLHGTFIPGVNQLDYTRFGTSCKVSCLFPTPALRRGANPGSLDIVPLTYSQWSDYLRRDSDTRFAYVQVSQPNANGQVSLGLAADFIPALLDTACRLIGIINPGMPYLSGSIDVPVERFDVFVESDHPLPEFADPEPDETMRLIADNVASLLRAGDVLQLGIGKLQPAVLQSLSGLSNLGLHGGMITKAALDLGPDKFSKGVTTGVALGQHSFYADTARFERVQFKPVSYTHEQSVLAGIDQFVAINSVLEVDLRGDVNAEYIGGTQVTALGGMPDFINGASRSKGGRSILALPSTTRDMKTSRIVQRLSAEHPASIPRADVQFVVTEYGVADLTQASVTDTAQRLATIAHPAFRDSLLAGA